MNVTETKRLAIRRLESADAPFILRLVNDPAFLEHIGDKGVRTLAEAVRYLEEGPIASYEKHGHGLYGVALRERDELIGISGLLRRDEYDDADLGYAFLPEFRGHGYATEAGAAVLRLAADLPGVNRVIALVSPANRASIRVLEALGFAPSAVPPAKPDTVVYERYLTG